jgi:hypothetical protein
MMNGGPTNRRRMSRWLLGLVLGLAMGIFLGLAPAMAHEPGSSDARNHRAGDLFPSYWAPAAPGAISAPLYVAPVPTPPHVGHTWVTYQPLYPHEFLYPHRKVFVRNNPQGGWTRVSVCWW